MCLLRLKETLVDLLVPRNIPWKFPSLRPGWVMVVSFGVMQIRMALVVLMLDAPAMAVAMRVAPVLAPVMPMLLTVKAVQSRLKLNGQLMVPLHALQQWQLMNMFLLQLMRFLLFG